MRKFMFAAAAAVVVMCSVNTAQAQVKDNAIKTNIFGMIVGQYQLAYERAVSENLSLQLSAGLISRSWTTSVSAGGFSSETVQKDGGFIIIPEARYYFTEGLKGFYGSAFFRYRSGTTTYTSTTDGEEDFSLEYNRTAIGGGVLLGYQFLIGEAFAIDLFLGPQFKSVSQELKDTDDEGSAESITLDGESDGVGVRFGVNIGYAF